MKQKKMNREQKGENILKQVCFWIFPILIVKFYQCPLILCFHRTYIKVLVHQHNLSKKKNWKRKRKGEKRVQGRCKEKNQQITKPSSSIFAFYFVPTIGIFFESKRKSLISCLYRTISGLIPNGVFSRGRIRQKKVWILFLSFPSYFFRCIFFCFCFCFILIPRTPPTPSLSSDIKPCCSDLLFDTFSRTTPFKH